MRYSRFLVIAPLLFGLGCQFEPFEPTPVTSKWDWDDHFECRLEYSVMSWRYNWCRDVLKLRQPAEDTRFAENDLILCRYDYGPEIIMPETYCRSDHGTPSSATKVK